MKTIKTMDWRLSLLPFLMISTMDSAIAEQGELWETRSSMTSSVHGKMDLGANRDCQASDWRDHPDFDVPGNDAECKSKKFERRGAGYVWSFNCDGSKGEGELRMSGNDQFDGTLEMDSPQGHFTLTMHGRRIGSCELGDDDEG